MVIEAAGAPALGSTEVQLQCPDGRVATGGGVGGSPIAPTDRIVANNPLVFGADASVAWGCLGRLHNGNAINPRSFLVYAICIDE